MSKTNKKGKKTKTKSKKSSIKTKTKPSNIMKSKSIAGAPKKDIYEIYQNRQHNLSNNSQTHSDHLEKITKKYMKVKHLEYGDKAIRKAKRYVEKIKKQKGSPDEIQEAEDVLNQALMEQEEAKEWLDPQTAIEKLTIILEKQILEKADNEQIQETEKSLKEAKESLELIQQGEKNALFFKLDPIVKTTMINHENEFMESNENEYQNGIESQDELELRGEIDNLPNIPYQKQSKEDTEQQIAINKSDGSKMYITNDDDENEATREKMSEGQRTPVSSGSSSSSPHVEVIQQKLNDALKILTPQEKIKQIRRQAKANSADQRNKKSTNTSISKQKTSPNRKNTLNKNSVSTNPISKISSIKEPDQKKKTIETSWKFTDNSSENIEMSSNESSSSDESSNYTSNDNKSNNETLNSIESNKDELYEDDTVETSSSSDQNLVQQSKNNTKSKTSYKSPKQNKEKTPKRKHSNKQNKISIARTYSKYYSIKLKIDKANVPVRQLHKHLKAFYKQLQRIDPTIIIYAYDSEIPSEAILKPNDIPTDISIMKKFFSNINVKPNGGHSWFQIWLGHDDSVSNILTNMKYWSSEQDTYLYHKRLQQKYSVKEYWLMWSTERMDPLILHQEVSHALSKMTKDTLHFSFSFGNIRKDPRFDTRTSSGKFNKAMIIEAKKEQKELVYSFLGKLFSTNSKEKIIGMNMRMVPMMNNELPSHTKAKVAHLISKQEQYLSVLRVKPCTYLQEIDYFNTNLNTTLREIIMKLETLRSFDANGNPMPVFTNVDYSEWHSCYVLTYPSHLEKEAEDYISQLPAFLHYIYGPEVLLMLTAEGQSKAQTSTWDPEKLCATSHLDLELDAVTSETSNIMWLPDLQTEIAQFDTSNLNITDKIFNNATDADSISTFKSPENTPKTPIISPSTKRNPSMKPSEDQTRESDPRNEANTTPKDVENSLGAPL